MRLLQRTALRQKDLRPHLLVCTLIVLGSAMAALRPRWVSALPLGCVLRRVTGIRCPFCGMTTDFLAMWHGHWPRENPFSPFAALVIYLLYPVFLLYTLRTDQLQLFSARRLQMAVLCVVGVMWVANNLAR